VDNARIEIEGTRSQSWTGSAQVGATGSPRWRARSAVDEENKQQARKMSYRVADTLCLPFQATCCLPLYPGIEYKLTCGLERVYRHPVAYLPHAQHGGY
jgi:hypothetical protein